MLFYVQSYQTKMKNSLRKHLEKSRSYNKCHSQQFLLWSVEDYGSISLSQNVSIFFILWTQLMCRSFVGKTAFLCTKRCSSFGGSFKVINVLLNIVCVLYPWHDTKMAAYWISLLHFYCVTANMVTRYHTAQKNTL